MVKLDLGLVRGVDRIALKRKIIGSIYQLCHQLGIEVICEGVETREELETLLDLGGDLFQGYLFASPAKGFPNVAL